MKKSYVLLLLLVFSAGSIYSQKFDNLANQVIIFTLNLL